MSKISTTIDLDSISESMASEFMFADVTATKWPGRFKDHFAAAEIAAEDVNRKFFPGQYGVAFDSISSVLSKARTDHYATTQPWSTATRASKVKRGGRRLLPNVDLFNHAGIIAPAKKAVEDMLRAIEPTYQQLVQEASANCNQGKFGPEFYPTFEEVAESYSIEVNYEPFAMPTDFSRMNGLDGTIVHKMIERAITSQAVMLTNALDDLWEDAVAAVQHIVDRFQDPEEGKKMRLHDSVLGNVMDFRRRLQSFTLAADPRVAYVCSRIDNMMESTTMKHIRDDATERRRVRHEAMQIVAAMQVISKEDADADCTNAI